MEELDHIAAHLMELLSERNALDLIVDYGSDVLGGNLVTVMDADMQLLARSTQGDYTDPVFAEQVRTGRVSERTFQAFREDQRLDDLYTRYRPVHVDVDPKGRKGIAELPHGMIIATIRMGQAIVGYFSAFGQHAPFPPRCEDRADLILKAITIEMQKSDFVAHTTGSAFEALMNGVMEDRAGSSEEIRKRFARLGRPLGEDLYLAVFKGRETTMDSLMRASHQKTLRSLLPGSTTIAFQENVVLLASAPRGLVPPFDQPDLETYLMSTGSWAGVSGPFADVTKLRKHYGLAFSTAQLGMKLSPERRVFFHAEQLPYHLISCATTFGDPRDLCDPRLLRLWEGGRRGAREMIESLFCYLRHMKGVTAAAQELHVHRNTLIYRVNRIAELAQLDLDDGSVVERVLLTQDILTYLHKQ